jgi:Cytochrome P450
MQFMPFIQGPRNCLGQNFALLEARIVLALLCKVRLLCCYLRVCLALFVCPFFWLFLRFVLARIPLLISHTNDLNMSPSDLHMYAQSLYLQEYLLLISHTNDLNLSPRFFSYFCSKLMCCWVADFSVCGLQPRSTQTPPASNSCWSSGRAFPKNPLISKSVDEGIDASARFVTGLTTKAPWEASGWHFKYWK